MAMQVGSEDDDEMSSINTTPLVDVMLVLLIVFLITIPVVVHTVPVQLPTDKTQPAQPLAHAVVLAVNKQGEVFLGEQKVSLDELSDHLQQVVSQHPSVQVQIRGDQQSQYEAIAKVIAMTRKAGVSQISFIIQPKS